LGPITELSPPQDALGYIPVSGLPPDALGPMANGASLGPATHFFESGVPLDAMDPLAKFPVSDSLPNALGPLTYSHESRPLFDALSHAAYHPLAVNDALDIAQVSYEGFDSLPSTDP
jgi:hypothetical protein